MKHAWTAPQWVGEGGMETASAAQRSALEILSKLAALARQFSPIPLIVFLIFVLSRPYPGIVQDAYIYMGRALADLDPDGVGRDLMFVHDGQFGFSQFRPMADALVWCFGLAAAAKLLAILAALAWFFGVCAFARQYASGATVWVAVIFTVLLPNSYGAAYPSIFFFAELSPVPRPFAEALVLAGLAALAARRDTVAILFIMAAALVHPIMAMAGLAVWAIVLSTEDKRWLWLLAFGGVAMILAGALGAPLLDRLFMVVDPSLKKFHEQRGWFSFPALWTAESFPPLIVQSATIAIAAHFQHGRRRRILAAIILAGMGGIAASAIFGDGLSSLLSLQAQPWRMAWLMAAVGAMALGICAIELWRRGPSGRIVLALLFLCWSFNAQLLVAGPAAILALLLHFRAGRYAPMLPARLVPHVWIFIISASAIWQIRLLAYPWTFFTSAPEGYTNLELMLMKELVFPLCALTAFFAIVRPRIGFRLQNTVAVLLLAAAFIFWDHRSPPQREIEENRLPSGLAQQIAERPGEVLWIDGLAEPWFVLGRPQWATPLQGGPIIFSDLLANEWRRRMQILMDLRLADQKSFSPWADPRSADLPRLSQDGVRRLCARADAPAWIIAPVEHGKAPGVDMTVWPLPKPHYLMTKLDGDYGWRRIDAYGVIACAKKSA